MMKYHDCLPSSVRKRRRERGFTLHETAVVIMILALAVAIGAPMMRRSLVRSELMGQVKMLQNAVAVSRMRAIKDGQWVVLALLKDVGGSVWTAPGGEVFAWVDDNQNRLYEPPSEELVNRWYLNQKTAVLSEGSDRQLFDLSTDYKGIVFLPTGIAIATKNTVGGIPGIGRGSVIVNDRFGNQIRLQIWSSTGAVDLSMKDPNWVGDEADAWRPDLRYWVY
jgi:prepilin-type N-terminal cleavage/methylation domain-containing protein